MGSAECGAEQVSVIYGLFAPRYIVQALLLTRLIIVVQYRTDLSLSFVIPIIESCFFATFSLKHISIMSSLAQLSQRYSPVALRLAKSPKVQAFTLSIGLFVALRRLNRWLSWRRANNGITRKVWDAPREIVVVTGGSSGIGAKIVELLEQRNIKVIILDVNAPPGKLGEKS
jgi:hypothetical protein